MVGIAAGAAGLVGAIEILTTKGPSAIKTITPFIFPTVAVYCISGLLLLLYREWKDRKSLQREKRLSEIKGLKSVCESVVNLTRGYFGPQRNQGIGILDLEQALERLVELLVRSDTYEGRSQMYSSVYYLRRQILSGDWNKINQNLSDFTSWIDYAEQELSKDKQVRLRDPLFPKP